MACSDVTSEKLGDLAAGLLDTQDAESLLHHLDSCGPCSEELDVIADLVAADPAVLAPQVPEGAARPWYRWLEYGLVAAAVLVLAIALPQFLSDSNDFGKLASLEPLPAPTTTLRTADRPLEDPVFLQAMERYRAGDFAAAAQLLEPLQKEGPALISLYQGIALLQVEDYSGANQALIQAFERGRGLVKERALWYQANSYLAQGKLQVAIGFLAQLEKMDGEYRASARQKLEALQDFLGK